MKTVTGQSIRFLPESFNQVLLTNGNVVSVKFLKSPSATGVDQGSLYLVKPKSAAKPMERLERLKLPEHKFKTMGEALGYLFKRLPLWSPEAKQSRYKRTYPFCACSEKEFMSWNIGKKLSAEVSCTFVINVLSHTSLLDIYFTNLMEVVIQGVHVLFYV